MIELQTQAAEPRENVRSYVYRTLYNNIMSVQLAPGTAMLEKEVASILETSRTPVREAFIHLAQERLLDILPQRGTFVAKLDMHVMEESRFMRVVLEEAVVREACKSFPEPYLQQLKQLIQEQHKAVDAGDPRGFYAADNSFHSTLFTGCDKQYVWQTLMQASRDYFRARTLNAFAEPIEIPLHIHEGIVAAIEAHDEAKGVALLHEHLTKFDTDVQQLKKTYPDYFL